MKDLKQEQLTIRQYLLGELDQAGRQQVESRLMADSEYKQEILRVEHELLEDYLAGALTDRERERFHQHYLSTPRQQRKLKIAQALNKYAAMAPPPAPLKSPWLVTLLNVFRAQNLSVKLLWGGAVALALLGAGWLVYYQRQSPAKQSDLEAELIRLNVPQNIQEYPDPSIEPITFAPLQLREHGDLKRVTITPRTKYVQLRAPLAPDTYQSYQTVFKINGGPAVFKLDALQPYRMGQTRMLVLLVPARILSNNDYVISASGLKSDGTTEALGDYSLRVLLAPQ